MNFQNSSVAWLNYMPLQPHGVFILRESLLSCCGLASLFLKTELVYDSVTRMLLLEKIHPFSPNGEPMAIKRGNTTHFLRKNTFFLMLKVYFVFAQWMYNNMLMFQEWSEFQECSVVFGMIWLFLQKQLSFQHMWYFWVPIHKYSVVHVPLCLGSPTREQENILSIYRSETKFNGLDTRFCVFR